MFFFKGVSDANNGPRYNGSSVVKDGNCSISDGPAVPMAGANGFPASTLRALGRLPSGACLC